jgi:hypothetical protein
MVNELAIINEISDYPSRSDIATPHAVVVDTVIPGVIPELIARPRHIPARSHPQICIRQVTPDCLHPAC